MLSAQATPRLIIPPEDHGRRLDRAVARLCPELGLRGRRRLCENGRVLVDGHPAGPAFKVRRGQELALLPAAGQEPPAMPFGGQEGRARLLRAENGLAALYKPCGLHTAALAGGGGASLEALLPLLLDTPCPASFPRLLNRLDAGTSGLVLAALTPGGERLWREAEARGAVDKRYLAVAAGEPPPALALRRALDTDQRIRTRVLEQEGEPFRRTDVTVLWRFAGGEALELRREAAPILPAGPVPDEPLCLVGCRIRRGARHQIRAHLAAAGCPLLGDAVYGVGSGKFFLHHGACRLPGFSACCPPFWEPFLPPDAARRGRNWLALMEGMVYSTSKSS